MGEVVISGIGSAFSESGNVQDFGRDLLANKHLVQTTKRWKDDVFTPVCGHIPHEYFDDLFFGINRKLATMTDPSSKIGYMRSFEAILDAGFHPAALSGSNTGVFACSGINEFEQKVIYSSELSLKDGYAVMGLSRTMQPNRISYYFNFNGPSCAIDGSWVGGIEGLKQAAEAIQQGRCEAALVVAGSISRYGETSLLLKRLGLATDQGATRSFDANGTGAVRSDGAVALFLQRADLAKRCYARVLATEVEFLWPRCDLDLTLPSPKGSRDFLQRMYRKHGIDPKKIAYLEADGNGNRIRDACELNAIDQALVQEAARESPLQIGSVKSNIGTVDCVNGLAAICKVVVAMETGIIPATINYQKPNTEATGLVAGRLKVVDKNTPLQLSEDSVLAVNTMALSNMMGHTVLGGNPRGPGRVQDPADHLPRLITFSARNEEAAASVASKIQSAPFDTNYYRLLQDVYKEDIRGYIYRGYVICPSTGEAPIIAPLEKKTVWFVYSGMGSQWAGMGSALMKLPVFAETIERLHAVLEPRGVDLKDILTDTGPTAFDNILKSFVGITACQVALTNVLTAIGVVPDGIVGHSVGELGCAYADGCVTEEQAILAAFSRGTASNAVQLIKGKMAAIGLGYQDVLPRLPPTIDVACHNSSTSCTLSGPAQDVDDFVEKLSAEGVFARGVNVSDLAYHSRYIQPAAPLLLQHLKEVIPEPKPRSSKWITTSVPVDKRDSELAKFCSAEYQTNNLLSPVLFEEALPFIPEQAVLIEVAPHGLLQAILKRALPDNVHIPLTQRGHADPLRFLLAAIGRMSFSSIAPKVSALYPEVDFPVPRGTPAVAPLVTWRSDLTTYHDPFNMVGWQMTGVQLNNDSVSVKVDGSRIYPLSEKLVLMWQSALSKEQENAGSSSISFQDILVKQWIALPSHETKFLQAQYMQGTKETQVLYNGVGEKLCALVVGHVHIMDSGVEVPHSPAVRELKEDSVDVSKHHLYQKLAAMGLEYTDTNKTITSIRMGRRGWLVSVAPHDSLAATLETVLQVYILSSLNEGHKVRLPYRIRRLDIDPTMLKNQTAGLSLHLDLATGVLSGAGVSAHGVVLRERTESAAAPVALAVRHVHLGDDVVRLQFLGVTSLSSKRDGGPTHLDYVGVLENGAEAMRVMGVGRWLPDDRVPQLDAVLRWPVPASWSTRDAATVPFVYALVYHALQVQAGARRGESILVHEGASAVGQAAIRVACQLGCAPLYTTVANSRERAALLAMFPQLQPAQVLSCGDGGSFEHRLRLLTRNRGVRLVVNTLAGAEFRASLRCLGFFSRLINFSRENLQEESIGSNVFLRSTGVFGCSGSELFHATEATRRKVVDAVAKGIRDGAVQPIVGAEDCVGLQSIRDLVKGTKAVIEVNSAMTESSHCDSHDFHTVNGHRVAGKKAPSRLPPLGDLFHNSSLEVLPSASVDQGKGADKDLSLSLTVDALAALSSADSQRSRRPRIVELTSLGPASHSSRENRNLFVLPPLSVLDPASKSQLAGLAARLFSPVLVVETTPGDSVQVAAKAVVQTVLQRQPHGPYNLLGWRLSTVLALEVQRQLEAAGKRGVLFLVHGDVTRVQQWAQQRLGGDAVNGVRDGLMNGEAVRAEEGAQVLDELLEAVAAHKSDVSRPFAGYVKIVRTVEDELQSLGRSDTDPHVKVRTLADRSLDSEALAAFINENAAWSQLAGEADLRLAVNLASSPL